MAEQLKTMTKKEKDIAERYRVAKKEMERRNVEKAQAKEIEQKELAAAVEKIEESVTEKDLKNEWNAVMSIYDVATNLEMNQEKKAKITASKNI